MNERTINNKHVKVRRIFSDVVKLEDLMVPYIQNIIEKIANDNNSKFDYN
ncbi:hypothetical protein [Priestia aryabhattai]